MSESAVEERLRQGLRRAAADLPDRELPPAPDGRSNHDRNHRHGRALVAGIVAAALVAGGTVVALRSGSSSDDDVRVADGRPADDATAADDPAAQADEAQEPPPSTTTTATTKPPDQVRVTNGRIPGQAVVVGDEIRLFDDQGSQTGTVSVAPLKQITAASSDLEGGFVVCGTDLVPRFPPDFEPRELVGRETPWLKVDPREIESVDELNELLADLDFEDFAGGGISPGRADQLMWFPADGAPVVLEDFAECPGNLQVVDSVRGPTIVRGSYPSSADASTVSIRGTVLATGETHELAADVTLDGSLGALTTTVTSARLFQPTADGFRLVDLSTGEELPIADIDANPWAKTALGPDGRSAVVVDVPSTGPATIDVDGPVNVTVFDLGSGEALYQGSFDMTIEGLTVSYDGTTLALGSGYEGSDPVTVVDLESGERRSLGVDGQVL